MGSILGDLPSFDPHNFSQLRSSDPSNPSELVRTQRAAIAAASAFHLPNFNGGIMAYMRMIPTTYHPTHNRTLPPPDQVITTEVKNILIRSFYQRAEERLRLKRPAPENLTPEHGNKHFRSSSSSSSSGL